MSSPEKNRRPTAANDLGSEREDDDGAPARAKRGWTPPTVTTFKVTDTQGEFGFAPGDGLNNLTNGTKA